MCGLMSARSSLRGARNKGSLMAGMEHFGLDVGIYGPLAEPETIVTLA